MKNTTLTLVVCIIALMQLVKANAQHPFLFTTAKARVALTQKLRYMVDSTFKQPVISTNFKQYQSAFWAMELMLYAPTKNEAKIDTIISNLTTTPPEFQRAFLEMLYTLYPTKYTKKILTIWSNLANAKNKAMALEYLAVAKIFPSTINYTIDSLQLFYYQKNISENNKLPKPKELLDTSFLPNQLVVVSFQYSNRNKPGYLMIRTKDHQWLTVHGKILKLRN